MRSEIVAVIGWLLFAAAILAGITVIVAVPYSSAPDTCEEVTP